MSDDANVDYGPLAGLIGSWSGDKGTDIAPDPDGTETNPYFETIVFSEVGNVTNAESQTLAAIHYHQIVMRKSDKKAFHNETGYWMWDAAANIVMHSLLIPRAVGLLAGGVYTGEKDEKGRVIINVAAKLGDDKWDIIQSPFMKENARTTEFTHRIIIGNGELSYSETTMVDIYGKPFVHTDENELTLAHP
jgi:hypothetical protein